MAILGVVRNGGDGLVPTLAEIERLRARLKWSRVLIATNDNEDGTDAVLAAAKRTGEDMTVVRLDGLIDAVHAREDRIAFARNILLYRLRALDPRPEMTLVVDLDGPNAELPVDTLLEVAAVNDIQWDAVFANQERAYYDLYALRHRNWCPGDCWDDVRKIHNLTFKTVPKRILKRVIVSPRQYRIPKDAHWIEVDSAFGGLGLYRTASIIGHWYSARDPNGRACAEHVAMHRSMRKAGARLYIVPELLNTSPEEHLLFGSGRTIPQKYLA